MGHLVGKDLYRQLGTKIDGLTARAPWNETFHAILKELYSAEEADLVVKMPYGLAPLRRIVRVTEMPEAKVQQLLEQLCPRGLVLDVHVNGEYWYAPSPLVIGIFEFTMMRTGAGLEPDARLLDSLRAFGLSPRSLCCQALNVLTEEHAGPRARL